jgi:hypothetical protein
MSCLNFIMAVCTAAVWSQPQEAAHTMLVLLSCCAPLLRDPAMLWRHHTLLLCMKPRHWLTTAALPSVQHHSNIPQTPPASCCCLVALPAERAACRSAQQHIR